MALTRHPQPAQMRLPTARLYLDDVDRLVEYLTEHVGPVSISVGDVQAESVDDLKSLDGEFTRELTLVASAEDEETWIRVRFQLHYAQVEASSGEPRAVGIVHDVYKIVTGRRRPFAAPYISLFERIPWSGLFVVFCILLFAFMMLFPTDRNATPWLFGFLAFASVVISAQILAWFAARSYSRIILRNRTETPSFWKRKGDDILVQLVVGIVLAVIGFVAGIAVERARWEKPAPAEQPTQNTPASKSQE
jgi:hypothetical protein